MTRHHDRLAKQLSRRIFLRGAAVGAGFAMLAGTAAQLARATAPARYAGLRTDDYLGQVSVLTKVVDEKVFTEGPAVDREGKVFFTNVPMNKILKWEPDREKLSVFRENSGAANGLYFDLQGRLLACEGDRGRVTRTDLKSGKIEVLADKFNGFPFAPPNDLCLD